MARSNLAYIPGFSVKYFFQPIYHCRQRAPVGIVLSSSGTSQFGMFDIQATTKYKYYDHIFDYILNPEDVVIGRLFLLVFTYMFLWLT